MGEKYVNVDFSNIIKPTPKKKKIKDIIKFEKNDKVEEPTYTTFKVVFKKDEE